MSDIKKHILTRLGSAGMKPEDLEKPGAHVLVTDGEDLHVLVKKTEQSAAIDKLEAEVPGYRGQIAVEEQPPLHLDELGEWRDFAVTGLSDERLAQLAEQSKQLSIFAPAKEGAVPPFYASVDLAFAMMEVLGRGVLAVRPIPPGERDGKTFIEVTPRDRRVIHQLTRHWVDDTIPAETKLKAAEAWRELQAEVYDTGLLGSLTLGLAPDRPAAPHPDIAAQTKAVAKHGLSGETIAYLEDHQIEVPEKKLSIPWLEETIGKMSRAPDTVVLELRDALGHAQEARERSAEDMFAVEGGAAKEKPVEIVYDGQRSTQITRQNVLSQLIKGSEGLGVPAEVLRQLGDQVAIASEPRKLPNLILIAGPKGSAAQPLLDITVDILGKKPLRIQGTDLTEPGWAVLFGHSRGFPTEGDAWLSAGNVAAHRETAADPAPIVFENLRAAGSADEQDQAHHQRDLMARIVEWLSSGYVNVYAREGRGAAKQKEVPLAGVAFVVRWEGPAKELRDLLSGSEQLAHLADHVVGLEPYRPEHAVNDLLRRVTFGVRQHFGPKGCTLELDKGARAGLEKAMQALGPSRAIDLYAAQMSRDVADAIKGEPATKYTIGWSNRLTSEERAGLEEGRTPKLPVLHWFGAKAG